MTQVTVPPMLSARSRNSAMRLVIRSVVSSLGQRTGRNASTPSRVILSIRARNSGFVEGVGCVFVAGKSASCPIEEVKATISMP